jgi:hypothetical protein
VQNNYTKKNEGMNKIPNQNPRIRGNPPDQLAKVRGNSNHTNKNFNPNNPSKQGKNNYLETNHPFPIFETYGHYTYHCPHFHKVHFLQEQVVKANAIVVNFPCG